MLAGATHLDKVTGSRCKCLSDPPLLTTIVFILFFNISGQMNRTIMKILSIINCSGSYLDQVPSYLLKV